MVDKIAEKETPWTFRCSVPSLGTLERAAFVRPVLISNTDMH
jgi:hypothetical protein